MTTTHRTLAGDWEVCEQGAVCGLKFHFPDMTPAQMAVVPERILWELCEIIDPPIAEQGGVKIWCPVDKQVGYYHRDYDLPAVITNDGVIQWFHNNQRHRWRGPAVINPDGRELWYHEGLRVKAGA